MKNTSLLFLFVFLMSGCRRNEKNTGVQFPGKPEVPSSILKEHILLLDQLHSLTKYNDSTGLAAIKLNELIAHHFSEEEDYVLPPLGLLPSLANNQLPENREAVILLTEKLKTQITHITVEHQMIKALLDELNQAALKENHPEVIEFQKHLLQHAISEEEIYFPASIIVGEYLKLHSAVK